MTQAPQVALHQHEGTYLCSSLLESGPAPLNWNPTVHQEQKLPASPDDTSKLIWSEIKLSVRLEFEMRDETPYSAKSETSNENKYMCAED